MATVAGLCDAAGCRPGEVDAWLGVCIGPRAFEVGADVLEAFGATTDAPGHPRFVPGAPGKWLADLAGLARDRLAAAGVERVSAATGCAYEDASRFFSYRRDRGHRADGRRRLDRARRCHG
jgi:copper oxidase (laccase) domain-containing protein